MKISPTRAALVVFLIGALGVWLIAPIGDACPDLGKLPAGSRSSSAPSFTPPLTRTCTYTTAGGIDAHQRYVPIVDWIVLGVLAGVVGLGVALLGGSGEARPVGRTSDPIGPPDWIEVSAEPAAPPKPVARAQPVARAKPVARARPVARAKPVAPAKPVARDKPVAPAKPAAPEPSYDSEAAARAAQREAERQQRARRRGR